VTTLAQKIVAVHAALDEAGVPHAFGGALALAFHVAEPRATRDIDLNVFVAPSAVRDVFDVLPAEIARGPADERAVEDAGQVRLFWDDNPVDLFFSTHPFHAEAATRVEHVPFAGIEIPVLGATELAVLKAFFDRTKDWADIEEMLRTEAIDVHRVLGWLVDLLGHADHRVARFEALLDERPAEDAPRFEPPG